MLLTRRKAVASLVTISASLFKEARAGSNGFVIVTASGEGPHAAAIEGIQRAFASRSVGVATFRLPGDEAALRKELNEGAAQLVIAVGIDGVRAITAGRSRIPLLSTMAFRSDLGNLRAVESSEIKLAGAVWLDLPVSQIVSGLRLAFPEAARFAVVRNPSQPDSAEALTQPHLLPAGVTVKTVDCASAPDLLASLRKLRGQVDYVICLPDSNLYNKTTVEPLILASLEHRLPLVGFSASFVRAGAAAGVYPDFAEVGRQTAALGERCVNSPSSAHEEYPRRTIVAVNERVLHLLGRDYRQKPGDEVLIVR